MFASWAVVLVELLVECVVKSTVLIGVVGAVLWALRVTDANIRHRMWTVVLLTMLALPALGWVLPAIEVPDWLSLAKSEIATVEETPLPNRASAPEGTELVPSYVMPRLPVAEPIATSTISPTEGRADMVESPLVVKPPVVPVVEISIPWQTAVAAVYLVVAVVLAGRLGLGILLTRRLVRRGRRLTSADHAAFAGGHAIVESSDVRTPATVGIWRPVILLPSDWRSWSDAAVELAIAHERSHVRRRDALTTLLANGNSAVYWFHPLAWWLRRKLADLAEQVCDDEVLRTHGDRACYAETLLTMASRLAGHERVSPLLVPMARQAQVETRIEAVIDEARPLCRRLGWRGLAMLLAIAVPVMTSIAALKPASPVAAAEADERPDVNRKAERSADERVRTTNPTRERGEEGTTNPTNPAGRGQPRASATGQRPELNAEAAKSADDAEKTKILVVELPKALHSESSRQQTLTALKAQGYEAKLIADKRHDGSPVTNLSITVPTEAADVRVVWESSYNEGGLRPRVVLLDKSGKPLEQKSILLSSESYPQGTTYVSDNAYQEKNAETAKAAKSAEKNVVIDKIVEPGKTMVQFFPHPTTPEVVSEAVRKLNQIGHNVTIRPTKNGTALLVEDGILPAPSVSNNPPFPTLEEQRAADLAYKLLGVELEKLSPEELERVKAKGYKGGLRVIQTKAVAENEMPRADSLHVGDILVGLHVWPTESLDQAKEILSRDDLDQLSPLKYYAIRHGYQRGRGGSGSGGGSPTGPDQVVSGRIQTDLDAWRAVREVNSANPVLKIFDTILVVAYDEKEMIRTGEEVDLINDAYSINEDGTVNFGPTYGKIHIAGKTFGDAGKIIQKHLSAKIANCAVKVSPEPQSPSFKAPPEYIPAPAYPGPAFNPIGGEQSSLLYDGKTFDEWRQMLHIELNPQKRSECLVALGAFGRAGKGQEAAKAILSVADEFNWQPQEPHFGAKSNFEATSLQQFVSLPADVIVPVILKAADDENPRVQNFVKCAAKSLMDRVWGAVKLDEEYKKQLNAQFPEIQPDGRESFQNVIPEPSARSDPPAPLFKNPSPSPSPGYRGGGSWSNPLKVSIVPFNKKPLAGSRNTYQVFLENESSLQVEQVSLSVMFPSEIVPDVAAIKAPVGAELVGDEVRFHPIAMLRPNERVSFQITASLLRSGEREIVAKIMSKDSLQTEVRQAVSVVGK